MAGEKQYSFQTGTYSKFSTVDYVLFGLILVVSAAIGFYFAIKDRRRNNTKTFLMAGGNMNPIPVALSLLASFMSAITLLGTPAEMYNYTTMYWWIGLSYFFVAFGAAHVFMPVFYRLHVTSAYEVYVGYTVGNAVIPLGLVPDGITYVSNSISNIYLSEPQNTYLERRFSRGVRTAGSMTFCIQMLLYMALVLYAPSLALNAVTGFTLWGSVISVGIVCTIYTTIGGMKAVLLTDSFQVFMMFAGLLAILIRGSMDLGGFSEAWSKAYDSGRIYFTDFSPDPATRHSAWSLVIGGTFTWVAIYGVNQAQVQRYCTCPSLKKAQLAIWLNFPGLCLILYLSCLIGMVVYGLYSQCDPFKFGLVTTSDQLLPLFVMDVLGYLTGFPGLFVACLFSGALSTVSSGLSALAAVVLEDVLKTYIWKDMSESKATMASKILALIFGIICLGLTYIASLLGGVLQAALSLFGMIGGPLLGLFILGMMFPWSNKWGAYAGLFLGLIFMFWIGVGAQIYPPNNPKASISTKGCNWNLTTTLSTPGMHNMYNMTSSTDMTAIFHNTTLSPAEDVDDGGALAKLYSLSYIWYSATAVLTTVVIGLIVSFITGPNKPEDVDPYLICPLFDILFPYLPEKIKKPMRFGVKFDKIKPEDSYGGPLKESEFDVLDQEIKIDQHETVADKESKNITTNGQINGALSIEKLETYPQNDVHYDDAVTKL